MKESTNKFIDGFFERNSHLEFMRENILKASKILIEAFENGNKLLICGNGGSASDSEHIVGELMKGFRLKRPVASSDMEKLISSCGEELGSHIGNNMQGALPAIALVSHTALSTAFCNDVDPQMAFAQQVYGYKKPGDVLIGISTSGNSKNVFYAASVAKAFNMKTISLTGVSDSKLSEISDVTIRSSEKETYRVQEDHLKIYHLLCAVVESEMFDK